MQISDLAGYYDYEILKKLNTSVNATITYKTDDKKYGLNDFWEVAKGEGDCEDYALLKLHKCLDLGIDISYLKLATCWVETGEYHCVLLVALNGQDVVLDNRFDDPFPPSSRSGYKWDRKQKIGGSKEWISMQYPT